MSCVHVCLCMLELIAFHPPLVSPHPHPLTSKGFDISTGECVLRRGDVVGPAELGLLATVGCTRVPVVDAPVVGVMSTGDEVVDAETEALEYGQVRDR